MIMKLEDVPHEKTINYAVCNKYAKYFLNGMLGRRGYAIITYNKLAANRIHCGESRGGAVSI
ncbi:hypothetical protein GCM10008018_55870 [Paenibacillus marchantiophytorum]|uniref:Uncharacterized protein n=1 Tax=Paenibacillus marchantiophytorum TaxID=1619310 RepID=A0ABQ1F8R7_9BACL|nr:hypothetical protein GCM10008018_55870 [Paenibacillus marchantiophytorum]